MWIFLIKKKFFFLQLQLNVLILNMKWNFHFSFSANHQQTECSRRLRLTVCLSICGSSLAGKMLENENNDQQQQQMISCWHLIWPLCWTFRQKRKKKNYKRRKYTHNLLMEYGTAAHFTCLHSLCMLVLVSTVPEIICCGKSNIICMRERMYVCVFECRFLFRLAVSLNTS